MATYNRYKKFSANGEMQLVPFAEITKSPTDKYEYYLSGITRLDNLSYKYYKDPNYGWMILQANPELGGLEFNIPNGSLLRIPYPLENAITLYENSIKVYDELYGND